MRKLTVAMFIFTFLTLSLTQLSVAEWKENRVTNMTASDIHVVFSTWRVAKGAVTATGYRSVGYYTITPGNSEKFWAYKNNQFYLLIEGNGKILKPQHNTSTVASWLPYQSNRRDLVFTIVTASFGGTTEADIKFSQVKNPLPNSDIGMGYTDGFIKYTNGSRITVTTAWVPVVADDGTYDVSADDGGEEEWVPADASMDDGGEEWVPADADASDADGFAEDGVAVVSIPAPLLVAPPVGSHLTIPLDITNARNVMGYQVSVNFDPSVLRYVSRTNGNYLPHAFVFVEQPQGTEGSVSIHTTGTKVGADSGTLATVTFEVVASKKPTIWLTDLILVGSDGKVLPVRIADRGPQAEITDGGPQRENPVLPPAEAPAVNTDLILDPKLRFAVERELGKIFGPPITKADMQTLLRLSITNNKRGQEIQNLIGLEFAKNLKELVLTGHQISDISPIAGLKNLEYLNLTKNQIGRSGISPIAGLKNLKYLNLTKNQISGISPIAGLKNLEYLDLSYNWIANISPIAGLKNLEYLDLSYNQISDISPIAGLKNLEQLKFTKNYKGLSDISPIAGLKNLNSLDLSYNRLSDISPIAELKNLKGLGLSRNWISDISPIAELKNLVVLDLSNNEILDFSPIAGLIPNLQVYFNSNQHNRYQCRTEMPANLEPLRQVRVTPPIQRTTMSSEAGASYGVTKAAVYSPDGNNRLWTPGDTVASSEEEKYSLVLTVEFLDRWKFEKERQMVERAATEWATWGNILFKFVSSGRSDIRVKFDDKKTNYWISDVGAPKTGNLGKYWDSNEPTMSLTTDLTYGIALHEFGHALGLTHEHLAPEFEKYFAWKFSGERLYEEISKIYAGYSTPPTMKQKEEIKHNYLTLREVDDEESFFDINSVMTYGLSDKLIEIRPAAPQKLKDIFAEKGGIPDNSLSDDSSLSDGDKEFIASCYGDPIARAQLSGTVHVVGEDDEFFKNEKIDETKPIFSHVVGHHHLFHGRKDKAMAFKWGGECRVEVYLSTRKIENGSVEVGVAALLYEGSWLDGGENTNDLEDIGCKSFKVPIGGTRGILIKLKNVSWGVRDINAREISCTDLDIDFKDGGLRGDLLGGGGDWANVSVTVSASRVSTTFAAPSMIVANHTSASEIAGRMLTSDVNGDGVINVADLVLVSNYLGHSPSTSLDVDINGDGIVTIADLVQVARHLGTSTYASAPSRVVVPTGLTYAAVKGWIDQARVEDDGSLVFRQGIAKLEYLLTLIIPEETALLHNYPNPFNPETWIPYHLATPADVTLTIYAVDGKTVRHLDLGHQAAGYYQSKGRAAYWDGRNTIGERVASGLYFYTLTAGDFVATGKMLIMK